MAKLTSVTDWLQARGLSQASLARDLGISTSTLCRLLSGKARCSVEQLVQISELTGIAHETLLGECAKIPASRGDGKLRESRGDGKLRDEKSAAGKKPRGVRLVRRQRSDKAT